MRVLLVIGLIAGINVSAFAQDATNIPANIISSTERIVTGAPFSADAVSETMQIGSDGRKITSRSVARIYRDSAGRFRREETTRQIGLPGVVVDVPPSVTITDPVSGIKYTLNIKAGTFDEFLYKPAADAGIESNAKADQNSKIESLGVETIAGVLAEGTRITTIIPANKIGNPQPVEVVSERWYSTELKVIVSSRNSDPRLGVQSYRLINLRRWEPPIEIFSPPPDYKLANDFRNSSQKWTAPAEVKKKPPNSKGEPSKPPSPPPKKPWP
jgi:hypothetical protein